MAAALMVGHALPARAQNIREEVEREQPKLTRPPRLIKFVPAKYPAAAQKQSLQGVVKLIIDIDAEGGVTRAEVTDAPDPSLAAAAVEAVKQFTFSPAEVNNKPSPIRIRYSYNFVLEVVGWEPKLPAWMQDRQGVPWTKDVVTGRVREQGTRLPLAGAAVAIPELGLEVKADGKGYFGFPEVPPGTYTIIALSAEHKREETRVEVEEGEQSIVTFYMPRRAVDPYETVVRGKRRKTVVTRVTLRQKELTTVPGTFGDPVRVVENLPGVARIPLVGGALLIRGSSPDDSKVFLDGIRVPQIYHFLGGPSVLNPQFLDRIDYYPGNADVRYGRLLTGVVDVSTVNTFTEQLGGAVDINLLNASVFAKVPITDNVSVAGAVRRSYIDAILPAVLDAVDRPATTVVPVYYDYQGRVDVKLPGDGDNQLYVLAFGSDDQLDVATNEPEDDVSVSLDSQVTFHRVLAGWRWQVNDRVVSKLRPTFGVDYADFEIGDSTIVLKQWVWGVREQLEVKVSPRLTWRSGLDAEVQKSTFDAEIPIPADYRIPGGSPPGARQNNGVGFSQDVLPVLVEQVIFGAALYSDAIIEVTHRLQLIPGARLELYKYGSNVRLSAEPRAVARYKLLEETTLKAGVGLFSKAPEPRFVNEQFGNDKMVLEHALHLSVGAEQQILPPLILDVQFYYNYRYDLAVFADPERADAAAAVGTARADNSGSGFSYGMEVLLKHNVTKHFYGWLAYTLSRSERVEESGGDSVRAPFDQTHILTLVASVRLGVGWEIGTRFRLVSGRPDTPIYGGLFDNDLGSYVAAAGAFRTVDRQLFHQLDLRVEKTWFFDLWRLSVYLDVQNVYNAENPEATLYDYRFDESGPLRGLPILPTLGVKGSF